MPLLLVRWRCGHNARPTPATTSKQHFVYTDNILVYTGIFVACYKVECYKVACVSNNVAYTGNFFASKLLLVWTGLNVTWSFKPCLHAEIKGRKSRVSRSSGSAGDKNCTGEERERMRGGRTGQKVNAEDWGISYDRFYRATARNATHGIAIAILSVRPSVCLTDACIVTKLNHAQRIFSYQTKGQSL